MKRVQIYIDEDMDDALADRARRAHTSKAALIRDAVRKSIGEPTASVDPFEDWIGGSEHAPAAVDDVVYRDERPPPRGALFASASPIAREADEHRAGFGER